MKRMKQQQQQLCNISMFVSEIGYIDVYVSAILYDRALFNAQNTTIEQTV